MSGLPKSGHEWVAEEDWAGSGGDEEDGEDADVFRVPHRHMDTPDGETIVDHRAGVEEYTLAMATY